MTIIFTTSLIGHINQTNQSCRSSQLLLTLNALLCKAVNQWNYAHSSLKTKNIRGCDCCREAVLHWQAVGNHQCSGTWKKIQKTQQCNCPPQHSFVFIWSKPSSTALWPGGHNNIFICATTILCSDPTPQHQETWRWCNAVMPILNMLQVEVKALFMQYARFHCSV